MKMVKSLILGSAAGLDRHERSTGCRSSRQGQSGRVREGLLALWRGFFYIPGTDTCIKLGGYLRVDTTFNGGIYVPASLERRSRPGNRFATTSPPVPVWR